MGDTCRDCGVLCNMDYCGGNHCLKKPGGQADSKSYVRPMTAEERAVMLKHNPNTIFNDTEADPTKASTEPAPPEEGGDSALTLAEALELAHGASTCGYAPEVLGLAGSLMVRDRLLRIEARLVSIQSLLRMASKALIVGSPRNAPANMGFYYCVYCRKAIVYGEGPPVKVSVDDESRRFAHARCLTAEERQRLGVTKAVTP